MNNEQISGVILTGTIGSHSYGTATPTSDYDLMSVVIPETPYIFGISEWGRAGTKSTEVEDPEKGLVEHKYFELKKFVGMCTGMNPNAIPLLWLDEQHYEFANIYGQRLLENRKLFNSRKAYNTFSGYAHGQLQKMGGVFNDAEEPNKLLRAGHVRFQDWAEQEIKTQRELRAGKGIVPAVASNEYVYDEGYLNAIIALKTHSKEEIKRIKDGPITGRMGAKRKALRDEYGYDTKFAFHTIRLMRMCVEFLKRPDEGFKVLRTGIDAEFLYSIRTGAFTQEQVKAMADELFAEARELVPHSDLPEEPDTEAINDMMLSMLEMSVY